MNSGASKPFTFRVQDLNRETKTIPSTHVTDDHIEIFRLQRSGFVLVLRDFGSLRGLFIIVRPDLQ